MVYVVLYLKKVYVLKPTAVRSMPTPPISIERIYLPNSKVYPLEKSNS